MSAKVVLQDAPDCPHTIAPADLLAFLVRPPAVADAHLVHAAFQSGNLGGNLRLKAKAVFLDPDLLNDLAFENLVADLHIGQIEVGQCVGEEREGLVADRMPEVQHAMRLTPDEPRPEDHIGTAIQDGLDQSGILIGVVFKIGILNNDQIALARRKPRAQGRALALVMLVQKDGNVGLALEGLEPQSRPIA